MLSNMKKISIFETTRYLKKYETPTLTVMRIASASLMAGSGPGANDQKDPSLQSSRMDEWEEEDTRVSVNPWNDEEE